MDLNSNEISNNGKSDGGSVVGAGAGAQQNDAVKSKKSYNPNKDPYVLFLYKSHNLILFFTSLDPLKRLSDEREVVPISQRRNRSKKSRTE